MTRRRRVDLFGADFTYPRRGASFFDAVTHGRRASIVGHADLLRVLSSLRHDAPKELVGPRTASRNDGHFGPRDRQQLRGLSVARKLRKGRSLSRSGVFRRCIQLAKISDVATVCSFVPRNTPVALKARSPESSSGLTCDVFDGSAWWKHTTGRRNVTVTRRDSCFSNQGIACAIIHSPRVNVPLRSPPASLADPDDESRGQKRCSENPRRS